MSYFREIPNLRYPSFLQEKGSSLDYVEAKNLFRRTKLRDDLQNNFTLFDKYEIIEGMRPDNVALELYESDQFDWVVLLVAGITNVRNEWPLSSRDLYHYAHDKYGESLNSSKFFETIEVKDTSGRLILPKGKVVNSDFTVKYYDNVLSSYQTKSGTSVRSGVSNYEHETKLNEDKRFIFILKGEFLQEFLNDFRDIMIYGKSSQFVNDTTIQTENLNISMP